MARAVKSKIRRKVRKAGPARSKASAPKKPIDFYFWTTPNGFFQLSLPLAPQPKSGCSPAITGYIVSSSYISWPVRWIRTASRRFAGTSSWSAPTASVRL